VTWLVLAAGCGGIPSDDSSEALAERSVARLDEHHFLGKPVAVENLTVWPVLTDQPLEIGEFLTLNDAQKKNLAVVRELGAGRGQRPAVGAQELLTRAAREQTHRMREGAETDRVSSEQLEQMTRELLAGYRRATVGTLEIENRSEMPILVCAGTVVKGGNQDRQIAQDFVVPPLSRVPVDAFCVERGRWSSSRHGKRTDGLFVMARAMAPTRVRAVGQYEKNQAKVWQEVGQVVESCAPMTVGTSLALSIDKADAAARRVERRLAQEVRAHFAAASESGPAPIGFAYAIDGKTVTVRTFAHPRILADHFDAFVAAMCMEADVAQRRAKGTKAAFAEASAEDVVALVNTIATYREELESTAAANSNGYRRGDLGFHSSCYVEQGKERIALTRDWTAR
jgi:hypothetical protein